MAEDINYRKWIIAKSIVYKNINKKYAYVKRIYDDFYREVENKRELSDVLVLLRMAKKEIDNHNSKISADRTRLDNLRYKGKDDFDSKLFKKYQNVSISKIEKAIKENSDLEDYEIFSKFFDI